VENCNTTEIITLLPSIIPANFFHSYNLLKTCRDLMKTCGDLMITCRDLMLMTKVSGGS